MKMAENGYISAILMLIVSQTHSSILSRDENRFFPFPMPARTSGLSIFTPTEND